MSLLPIVPLPKSVQIGSGTYSIGLETEVLVEESRVQELPVVPALEVLGFSGIDHILQPQRVQPLHALIDQWIEPLRKRTGVALPIQKGSGGKVPKGVTTIVLHYKDDLLGLESYELVVTPRKVCINASGGVGFFWAIQTLLQITKEDGAIPCCSIADTPRFAWRGLHLDCGRHYLPLESIKRFIDTMALHKLNIFHWHLTEDQGWRLEIKRYPKLTEVGSSRKETLWGHLRKQDMHHFDGVPHGGFYSQEEAQEIVQYARDRGIMVVPEIDLPGHSQAAIAAYPELGLSSQPLDVRTQWGVCPNIYNPEESTVTFLKGVMDEVIDIFPSPWIHVGGDEAVKEQWDASSRVQELIKERGLKDSHEMQSWFIGQISSYLRSFGRKVIGWDEVMEGGAPEGITVMAWRHPSHGVIAAQQGLPVLMAPLQWTYFDFASERTPFEPLTITSGYRPYAKYPLKNVYRWSPIPKELTPEEGVHILGGQGQVWTEYMQDPKVVEFLAWPRGSALAERLWSDEEQLEYKEFTQRLPGVFRGMEALGVGYQFWNKLKREKPLKATEIEEEFVIPLEEVTDLPKSFRRIQVQFARWGSKGYALIKEVSLESSGGRVWKDSVEGYVGDFNRLNVYTFGDGTPIATRGATLRVRLVSCGRIPGVDADTLGKCPVAWAWRTE